MMWKQSTRLFKRMSRLLPPMSRGFTFPSLSSIEAKMYPKAPVSCGSARNLYEVKKGGEGEAEIDRESPTGTEKSNTACEEELRYR